MIRFAAVIIAIAVFSPLAVPQETVSEKIAKLSAVSYESPDEAAEQIAKLKDETQLQLNEMAARVKKLEDDVLAIKAKIDKPAPVTQFQQAVPPAAPTVLPPFFYQAQPSSSSCTTDSSGATSCGSSALQRKGLIFRRR